MHEDDNLSNDAFVRLLFLVEMKTRAMVEAAKAFQASPRDDLTELETKGRPLPRDLRSLASTLETLAASTPQPTTCSEDS